MKNTFLLAGSISGAVAVMLGAFAAHGLDSVLSEENLRVFHTAVEYQFYHTFALLITGLFIEKNKNQVNSYCRLRISHGHYSFFGKPLFTYSNTISSLDGCCDSSGRTMFYEWVDFVRDFIFQAGIKKFPSQNLRRELLILKNRDGC